MTLTTPKGAVTVRLATPADAAALRALRLEALSQHPEVFGADYETALGETAADWAERLRERSASGQEAIAVAEAGGALVGMTGVFRGRSSKTRHSGMIWGVYVQAAWRGLRLAEALIEHGTAWARENGLTVLRLAVITSNVAAVRAYLRCGFTLYGVEPQVICHAGTCHDEFLMAKVL